MTEQEMVVVQGGRDSNPGAELLGSEDATTCHIVCLVERHSRTAALAHLGTSADVSLDKFVFDTPSFADPHLFQMGPDPSLQLA